MWKRLVLVELHAGFQISNKEVVVKPKFAVHDVETRFPFLYASTRLDTKTSIIASNRSFKAVRRFVVLLLSSFWDFPFLPRVFPLPLATLLVIVTSSSTLHWAIEIKKKVSAMGYFSREILIRRHWRQEVLLSYGFAVSGGEIISWRGASCLRTFMS